MSESDEAPLIPTSTSDGTTVRVRMPEGASGEEEGVEEDPSSVDVHARFPKERCKTAVCVLVYVRNRIFASFFQSCFLVSKSFHFSIF